MKKLLTVLLIAVTLLAGCQSSQPSENTEKTYTVGICNYVDDASLNQIVDNIEKQLEILGQEKGVTFRIEYQNANADMNIVSQIVAQFIAEDVDLMIGVATPVALEMARMTEDKDIPVVFAAVSDPLGCGLVESMESPTANITGTSDFLNTEALIDLIVLQNPEIKKVGFLYDMGQDSSTQPIATARKILEEKGIEIVEKTGTNVDEIRLAVDALIAENVEAVFTPTDNTVMTAELSIYQSLADAKIPHYAGADSFALNGAFLGYGVDYALLGQETANIVSLILVEGKQIAEIPVYTFDNGTATINTDICAELGYSYDEIIELFTPYCTAVKEITTADSFDEVK